MQWPDLLPLPNGSKAAVLLLLCLAMLCFPFSVAAANVAFGIVLATGLLTGIWWQGIKALWRQQRGLSLAIAAYLLLVLTGVGWSIDPAWGAKIIGRHWFWLLLPILVLLLADAKYRTTLLASLSLGLALNLIYCVLQIFEVVSVPTVGGSSASNPTGHIGHTSFGFIYGIWAAWLLHLGFVYRNRYRWLLRGLAAWALVMVFISQGKSGYLVSLVAMLIIAVKWLQEAGSRRLLVSFASVLLLLTVFMLTGPGKERLLGTWQALTGNVQEDLSPNQQIAVSSATARLAWWQMSYRMWLERPILGAGTGGFPKAAAEWQAEHAGPEEMSLPLVHPHNQYLLALVRWGAVGLLSLLALLYFWIRAGMSGRWRNSTTLPLVAVSGVALAVHGLSSASLEEHFSTIFALVLVGAGLSASGRQHGPGQVAAEKDRPVSAPPGVRRPDEA